MFRKSEGASSPWLQIIQRYQSGVGLFLLFCVAYFIAPKTTESGYLFHSVFFSVRTLQIGLSQVAVPGLMAVGATFVIISGGIDLSAGSVLGLLNCVCAALLVHGKSSGATFGIVLALGGLIGAGIGLIINATKLQPFIVTLAAMVTLRGVAFVYTNSADISGIGDNLKWLDEPFLTLPIQAWLLLAVTCVAALVLKATIFGRRIYAIGGNVQAARYAGVPIGRVRVGTYALNGLCIALAAILFTGRNSNGQPSAGSGYELDAITAAVVGGTALTGGFGNILGTFVGASFIVCLNILLIFQGVSYYIGQGWKGVIILLAVYLQNIGRKTA